MNALRKLGLAVSSLAILGTLLAQEKPAPSAEQSKKDVLKYLQQKTGRLPAGTSVPKGSPWVWALETYEAVPKQDPKILYGWVAEHLAVADKRYLNHKDVEERRKGLGLVCEACKRVS